MSTTTTTTVKLTKAVAKRAAAIYDRSAGRSKKNLADDLADARELAELCPEGMPGREFADAIGRGHTDVARMLRAAKLDDEQVNAYLAAGKRVVSVSGLITFCTTGGSTPEPQTTVQRATSAVAKLDTVEELDAVIKAAQARKRELVKAAKNG